MKRILLTGGAGFFCTRFTERYKNEYEILSLGRQDLDITDVDKTKNIFNSFKPDYVIHAAAIAVTDFCNKNPEIAYKINVEGSVNIAKITKEVGAKLIFISSEQVFNGNKERGPYDENHKPVPNTVYGENKLEAEKLLKEIIEELWIVRFTWLFDLPQKGLNMASNIIWEVVSSLIKGEEIKASPDEFRGMTYANEMVENFKRIFDIPYGTYHLGSKNDFSRYEVVEHILTTMGLQHRIKDVVIKDSKKYKDLPRDVRLNTDKAENYGLKFSSTKEGLSKCIHDYKLKF